MYNGSTFQRGLLLHLFFGFSYDLQVRCKTYSATLLFGQITLLRHWRAKRLRPTRKQGKTNDYKKFSFSIYLLFCFDRMYSKCKTNWRNQHDFK